MRRSSARCERVQAPLHCAFVGINVHKFTNRIKKMSSMDLALPTDASPFSTNLGMSAACEIACQRLTSQPFGMSAGCKMATQPLCLLPFRCHLTCQPASRRLYLSVCVRVCVCVCKLAMHADMPDCMSAGFEMTKQPLCLLPFRSHLLQNLLWTRKVSIITRRATERSYRGGA